MRLGFNSYESTLIRRSAFVHFYVITFEYKHLPVGSKLTSVRRVVRPVFRFPLAFASISISLPSSHGFGEQKICFEYEKHENIMFSHFSRSAAQRRPCSLSSSRRSLDDCY